MAGAGGRGLPTVAQAFGVNGLQGVPASDVEAARQQYVDASKKDPDGLLPPGRSMSFDLRVPIDDETRKVVETSLSQYAKAAASPDAALPPQDPLLTYSADAFRPAGGPAFAAAKEAAAAALSGLPAYEKRAEIEESLQACGITIVSGEVGCGKSTVVPQVVLAHEAFAGRRVLHVSADALGCVSVATKVAADHGVQVGGDLVGYNAPFEVLATASTQLLCTTAQAVLCMLQRDAHLSDVGCVILDSFEKLDAESEVILAHLRQVLARRTELRVVVCVDNSDGGRVTNTLHQQCESLSATMSIACSLVELTDAPQLPAGSPQYLEEILALLDNQDLATHDVLSQPSSFHLSSFRQNGLVIILSLLSDFHANTKKVEGKIVVFLPSWGHMQAACEEIHKAGYGHPIVPVHPDTVPELIERSQVVATIHAAGPVILLATHSSHLPITDAQLVIDCGHALDMEYDHEHGMLNGDVKAVSKLDVDLRSGLAASSRIAGAQSYHLVARALYENFTAPTPPPLSATTNLAALILRYKAVSEHASVPELLRTTTFPPPEALVAQGVEELKNRGLVNGADGSITPLGRVAAALPLPLHLSKMLFFSVSMRCLDAALTIASCLLSPPLFSTHLLANGADKPVGEKKLAFSQGAESDLFSGLHAFLTVERDASSVMQELNICHEALLNHKTVQVVRRLRSALLDLLKQSNVFDPVDWDAANANRATLPMVKACIVAGLYPNVALVEGPRDDISVSLPQKAGQTQTVDHFVQNPTSGPTHRSNAEQAYCVYTHAFYTTVEEEGGSSVKVASLHGVTNIDPFAIILFSGAGALKKLGSAEKALQGRCRGWFPPEPSAAWAKSQQTVMFINSALQTRQQAHPTMPPDNPTPTTFLPFAYSGGSQVEIVLDKKVNLVADEPIAKLSVSIRKAVVAVTAQRASALSEAAKGGSAALFPADLVDLLQMVLQRCTNPSGHEVTLRHAYWNAKGGYQSQFEPVFRYGATPPPPGPHGGPPVGGPPPGAGLPPGMPFPPPGFPPLPPHRGLPPPGFPPPGFPPPHGVPPPGVLPGGVLPPPGVPPHLPPSVVPPQQQAAAAAAAAAAPPVPEVYQGEQPTAAEQTIMDRFANIVSQAGDRGDEVEDTAREQHKGNPSFAFLDRMHRLNGYYEWKLKQLQAEAQRDALRESEQQQDRQRQEERRKHIEEAARRAVAEPVPLPQGDPNVAFVPRTGLTPPPSTHMPPPPPPPPPVALPLQQAAPTGAPAPPPGPPPKPVVIRRPTTPKTKPLVEPEDVPLPLTESQCQEMSLDDVLEAEKARLGKEVSHHTQGVSEEDQTPMGAPPDSLLPKRLGQMQQQDNWGKGGNFGGKDGFKGGKGGKEGWAGGGGGKGGKGKGTHLGPLVASGLSLVESGTSKPITRPSVLVGPIPPKSETKGSNLPLILAKALGESLGQKVGPTLIVGLEARIDVPSYNVEERALKKEFFVCLGRKIYIHKNDRIQIPEKSFLADRLDSVRQNSRGGDRGGGRDWGRRGGSEERRGGGDRGGRGGYGGRDGGPSRGGGGGGRDRDYGRDRERDRDRESRHEESGGGGGGGSGGTKRPRPGADAEPSSGSSARPSASAPPAKYTCPKCKEKGQHWVKDCPTLRK